MSARNHPTAKPDPTIVPPKTAIAHESTPELRLLGEMRPLTTREERIAMSAYWRAASRQFEPGHELDDWLAAEQEVDSQDGEARHSR